MNLISRLKRLSGRYVMEKEMLIRRKYRLSLKRKTIGNYRYRQLIATRDFLLKNGDVIRKGTKGGWVSSDKSLSHEGKCWIDEKSIIQIDASVSGDAWIVQSKIGASSDIKGDAAIFKSEIGLCCLISGDAFIQSSKLDFTYLSGKADISSSTLNHFHSNHDVFIQDSNILYMKVVQENKVNDVPKSVFENVQYQCLGNLSLVASYCVWKNIDLIVRGLRVHAPSLMESVTSKDSVSIKNWSPLSMRNVVLGKYTSLRFNSDAKNTDFHIIEGESEEYPILMHGHLYFSGEKGNTIMGQCLIRGTWVLINTKIFDSSQLITNESQVTLWDSTLRDLSEMKILNSGTKKTNVEINHLHLSGDDVYNQDSNENAI